MNADQCKSDFHRSAFIRVTPSSRVYTVAEAIQDREKTICRKTRRALDVLGLLDLVLAFIS